jgi:hypothetical protein
VFVLFMVIAFWLGGNVVLATAVWCGYRRQMKKRAEQWLQVTVS